MTTDELLVALAREYPNGVSFAPMAVRLLRQKVQFEDCQVEHLKTVMFQLGSGLWISREMIAGDESLLAFNKKATLWLELHGCFSVEQLYRDFCDVFRNIVTPKDCVALLRHLGFTVAMWGNGGYFCFQPPHSLDDHLTEVSQMIADWLEEAHGTLTFHEIEQALPHLTAEALEAIRLRFLPEVHVKEIGGVPCWCNTKAIRLPEDFSEKVTTVIDTLVELGEKVSTANIEFAINLLYRIRFRNEYALTDKDAFVSVCAKHYQGMNNVLPVRKKSRAKVGDVLEKILGEDTNDRSGPGMRVRSLNTRFCNLGVPVGAELVFTKDTNITCIVLDNSNQVKYEEKAWSISALASHLLEVSSANGFCHFRYEGEILWARRLRLEQVGKSAYQAD